MKFQYSPPKNSKKTPDELIADLQAVAKTLNTEKLSQSVYKKHGGKYNPSTFETHFGSWNKALLKAGLSTTQSQNYSDEKLFENLLNIWQKKGTQPTRRDMNTTMSKISYTPYTRRFGTWTNAIKQFIEYANGNDVVQIRKTGNAKTLQRKTARDPSLRLRFKVLKRDNFSCVQCGESPAKNHKIELHVDHIKPYSRGGETEISNLQTLCQNCNWGKSNLE